MAKIHAFVVGVLSLSIITMTYLSACTTETVAPLTIVSSLFAMGQLLCGNTHPYGCPSSAPSPWGIVIYADPNPEISGFYGLGMSIQDVVQGFHGSGTGTVWATSALQNTDISANNYGIYGGINGTFTDHPGNP